MPINTHNAFKSKIDIFLACLQITPFKPNDEFCHTTGTLLGGPRLLGCLMISLVSRSETYHYFYNKMSNLAIL